ncbi:DUF262 domain-containing protein [Rathayibacter sp. AY1A5]|uniref:DUF262 domain-containing protein n=1 Tax=Rathayibacter sp. AY1A5 TaxID=2080523 RepID=UPI000CE7A5B7|nr:DUF262 domain-containing protein [Rathayibacter sp. AY1A5]PPF12094.1 hypothetical protein C5B98_05745 [Rathayibacter sp. AY1A5]
MQEMLAVSVGQLVRMVDDGVIGLPNFQRDFVWPPSQVAALLDSVARQWPIGTLLLVPPLPELPMRPIAGAPTLRPHGVRYLVLDGQQRLTALYQAISGVGAYGFALNQARDTEKDQLFEWSPAPSGSQTSSQDKLRRLLHYNVPCVLLAEHKGVSELAQIFEAINTPGVPIDVFDLANARASSLGEDLRKSWEELSQGRPILTDFDVTTLDILRLVALDLAREGSSVVRGLRASDLLEIRPEDIVDAWPQAINNYADALTLLAATAGVVGPADLPSKRAVLLAASSLPRLGPAATLDIYWNSVLRLNGLSDKDVIALVRSGDTIRTGETARFANAPFERESRGENLVFARALRGLARINGVQDPIDGNKLAQLEIREFEYESGYGIIGPATVKTELMRVIYLSSSSATIVRTRLRAGSGVPDFALDPAALASQGFSPGVRYATERREKLLRWLRGVVSEII